MDSSDVQFLKKGCRGIEALDEIVDVIQGPIECQGFESIDMLEHEKKRVIGNACGFMCRKGNLQGDPLERWM